MKRLILLGISVCYTVIVQAQAPDSVVTVQRKQELKRTVVLSQATIRSALLPGLGQIYNRQYWKVPVIYSGVGIGLYFLNRNQRLYMEYLAGYATVYNSLAANPTNGTKTATVRERILTLSQLKRASDYYRQQRDLTIILMVAGWAANAIEANVAAHLKTFDLSENLSMQVSPHRLPVKGMVPGIRVAVRFKD